MKREGERQGGRGRREKNPMKIKGFREKGKKKTKKEGGSRRVSKLIGLG